jgi:SAM-dependent methyltransferase
MSTVSRPACPACGGVGAIIHDQTLRDGSYGAPGVWSAKKCVAPGCGLVWLDPMPAPEDLLLAYQNYYTHADAENAGGFAKKAYRFVIDTALTLTGILGERRRADLMFLDEERPSTLLDVGCGHGRFLSQMAARGWKVAGVDFDPDAVKAARSRGLDVGVGGIESMLASGAQFDFVTASHVIEHVPDPALFLAQCKQVLKPNGRLILRTPNANSLGHGKYGPHWRGLEPPRHLCVFTRTSLQAMAQRAGYAVDKCFTSVAMSESVLVVSHFLRRDGKFNPAEHSGSDFLVWKLLGPLLAIYAKLAWVFDRESGEEICAVLKHGHSAAAH